MQLISYHGRTPNFGDDLNACLWPALAPDLFDGNSEDGFLGIGTVIGMPVPGIRTLHVFGSGIGNNRLDRWRDQAVRYWCVRGPISARLLGVSADLAITDGAVLTPLVHGFPAMGAGGGGTVIVPHWQTLDHPGWPAVAAETGFELIDPRADPRLVVERIARADLVLAEAMHGAIIADTYGVPWIAFATSKNFGSTKWVDWAMSLGLEFDLTPIPPPSPCQVLAFGRGGGRYGETFIVDVDTALRDFEERVGLAGLKTTPTLANLAKQAVRRSSWTHPFLGFSPARTSRMLTRLAASKPCLSAESVRLGLRARLQERLAAVVAANAC